MIDRKPICHLQKQCVKITCEPPAAVWRINVKTETIDIVDRGRGPQLSTSRITVQDLVPYFQEGASTAEIIKWIPSLTDEEIGFVRNYYLQNQADLNEEDKQIRAYVAEQVRQQRLRFPPESRDERLARMKATMLARRKERNGERHLG